jgi:hypothetical protein
LPATWNADQWLSTSDTTGARGGAALADPEPALIYRLITDAIAGRAARLQWKQSYRFRVPVAHSVVVIAAVAFAQIGDRDAVRAFRAFGVCRVRGRRRLHPDFAGEVSQISSTAAGVVPVLGDVGN